MGVREVAIVISAVLVLVLCDCVNPFATLALWVGLMQCYYGMCTLTLITQSSIIRHMWGLPSSKLSITSKMGSILKKCEGGCDCHQCSVGFSFVGFREPLAPLALWIGWTQHYYGKWTLTLITQSSVIRHMGDHLPQSCTSPARWAVLFEWVWGRLQLSSVQCWC